VNAVRVSLLLALLALPSRQQPAAHGPEPGPRAALAGMVGFETISRLDFGEQQNRLTAVYVFPDRVRWHFESYGARQRSEHQYFYRAGERVSELVSGRSSRALEGAEHDAVLLQMELRRAAMLWPDGFDWKEDGSGTRSAVASADSCCRELPLGSLVATLEDGRPRRIEARDALGRALETLEIREWQERGGRKWPRTLALQTGSTSFVETVESIETRVHYLELSFLPPDLRPLTAPTAPGATVLSRDLVSMTYSVHELPADLDWDAALTRARDWIAEAGKQAGLSVDPVPTFELTPEGRPMTCLVRLQAPVLPAPAGFETHAERAGLFLTLRELGMVDAAALERITQATPPGALPGVPYLRVHAQPSLIELVLPLAPVE